ncbi:raffinose/stachyose/melibiose transport system permease protein [Actinopolymorpha cephalotaxi]|uniref:Raffinose/stachyose/melibiose transport system permease protein n=1 Tax=Actinopolymorpha cephalotaxi TaxID=504797 RepID=A0A1I2T8J9_9ACTN|nr:carbohydrate ABC transporter permease [Actinopolymorpha cephalotaxi]NYH82924.1 raffinose/stachyose/melibiose transport system permease protein [Actinopolymorpha cephalotaxi]SFG59517.1 raffinose/stachyose/melibiose transport system permease protein [Actinopolymorpha cephalotaxi]
MISKREATLNYLILGVFAIIALFPLLGVLTSALTDPSESSASLTFPSSPHFENFLTAWNEGHFGTYMRSSVLVTVSVVVISSLLAVLAGYAFATMRFRGQSVLFYILLLGLMVPSEALIIPLYYDLRGVGLTDTYWALIFPQVAQSLAFCTFWMRSFFRGIPTSLIEAAKLDGATRWSVLWKILVPISRPALLTMAMLVFMWTWNEFLMPLVMITSENLRTAPLGLAFFQGQHTSQFSLLAAGATIVAAPVVIVYLFLQRHFIAGMLAGAVK